MNKILILMVFAALISFHHPNINQTEVNDYLENIDLKDVKAIKFYKDLDQSWVGRYFRSGVIYIDMVEDWKDTVNHELKHSWCYNKYHNWAAEMQHSGCFIDESMGLGGYCNGTNR